MRKKVLLGVAVALVVFFSFVATRPSTFLYASHGTYQAKPEKIFPYLVSLKMGNEWSPYMKKDPNMKVTLSGPEGEVGSVMEFEGNSDVGAGRLEVVKVIPNEAVDVRLTMTKPFHGENLIHYTLENDNGATKFTWAMEGESGFLGKLISVFIDCEKMVTADFEKGIANLRPLVEQI